MSMVRIPLSKPDITQAEIDAVVDVLHGTRLSLGSKMQAFEEAMAAYIGVSHGVAVSSGTAGLHLALLALGIQEGDEVILPSFTFVAAANAIRYVNATPVFVDVDPVTLNMDPHAVELAITSHTRGLMVVHTFGIPADMQALSHIAARHGLHVIEDACEAIGAAYQGRRTGSFGDVAVFSFYPNKPITTGEGGVVVTDRADLAEKIRALRNQGRASHDGWLQHSLLGYNYRLPEINCALGIVQLSRLDAILARRSALARTYRELLGPTKEIDCPLVDFGGGSISWFVYVVRLNEHYRERDRDLIAEQLAADGIETGRYFPPLHRLPLYAAFRRVPEALPVTNRLAGRTLAIPFFNALTLSEMGEVCRNLQDAIWQISRRH